MAALACRTGRPAPPGAAPAPTCRARMVPDLTQPAGRRRATGPFRTCKGADDADRAPVLGLRHGSEVGVIPAVSGPNGAVEGGVGVHQGVASPHNEVILAYTFPHESCSGNHRLYPLSILALKLFADAAAADSLRHSRAAMGSGHPISRGRSNHGERFPGSHGARVVMVFLKHRSPGRVSKAKSQGGRNT